MARTQQIPLDQIDPPQRNSLNPGDSVTALVTFHEKGARRTQWLVYLQVAAPNASEKSAQPFPPMTIYSICGSKMEFTSSPAYVSLRTLAPFAEPDGKRKPPKVQDKSARFALNRDFLGLGLDKAATVVLRLNEARTSGMKGSFAFGSTPFSDAEVKTGRQQAETLHLTSEEERALAASGPAMFSYFSIVQRTSGLEDILFKILDMPSLWSVLRRGGINTFFRMRSEQVALARSSDWGLPGAQPLYHMPMVLELNNQPALNITLVVTAPQPPLLACGGIVGMLAERPGDKEHYLTLRIISARSTSE